MTVHKAGTMGIGLSVCIRQPDLSGRRDDKVEATNEQYLQRSDDQ